MIPSAANGQSMRTLTFIFAAGTLLLAGGSGAQTALDPTKIGPSQAVRLLPAPPIFHRVTPPKGRNAIRWTSPSQRSVLFRPATITLDWTGAVPMGTTYSVSMSEDGTKFDRLIDGDLTESHLHWDLPDLARTTVYLRVKGTAPNGQVFASNVLTVHSVPKDAIVVSKTNQRLWAFKDGRLQQRYLVSTGQIDYDTRAGWFSVYSRQKEHHSSIYDVDMPYALFFSGGQAIHSSSALRHLGSPASHGCVRLPRRHARELFDDSAVGRPVIITDWKQDMSWLDRAPRVPRPAPVKATSASARRASRPRQMDR